MSGRRRQGTTPAPAPAPAQEGLVGAGGSAPAPTPQGAGPSEVHGSPAMVHADLMVEQHVLECRICFLPLKPPVFQCGVGHVVCSSCFEELTHHLCGDSMPEGYKRCHAMEDVMNAIRGPCPHARYGCDATPVYHAREEHLLQCPHAPCHCPAEECTFVGSKAALLDHCSAAHEWPCITTVRANALGFYDVRLRDGFNLLLAGDGNGNNSHACQRQVPAPAKCGAATV